MAESSHVFISYSRRNADTMARVSQALREAGILVWTDEKLTAGTPSWKDAIEHALQGAFAVVVLMSPPAKASEWVERELDYAYVLQCPIYPLLVEGTQRDAVPFELITMQYIDIRTDFDQGMRQLIGLLAPGRSGAPEPNAGGAAAITPLEPRKAPQRAVPVPFPVPMQHTAPPTLLDRFWLMLGLESDDDGRIAEMNTKLRRVSRWYYLEPRRFRLFNSITHDNFGRLMHSGLTALICLWVIGWAVLFPLLRNASGQFPNSGGIEIPIVLILFVYGIGVLVSLATPYQTRRALLRSILFGVALLFGISVLLLVTYALFLELRRVFG